MRAARGLGGLERATRAPANLIAALEAGASTLAPLTDPGEALDWLEPRAELASFDVMSEVRAALARALSLPAGAAEPAGRGAGPGQPAPRAPGSGHPIPGPGAAELPAGPAPSPPLPPAGGRSIPAAREGRKVGDPPGAGSGPAVRRGSGAPRPSDPAGRRVRDSRDGLEGVARRPAAVDREQRSGVAAVEPVPAATDGRGVGAPPRSRSRLEPSPPASERPTGELRSGGAQPAAIGLAPERVAPGGSRPPTLAADRAPVIRTAPAARSGGGSELWAGRDAWPPAGPAAARGRERHAAAPPIGGLEGLARFGEPLHRDAGRELERGPSSPPTEAAGTPLGGAPRPAPLGVADAHADAELLSRGDRLERLERDLARLLRRELARSGRGGRPA